MAAGTPAGLATCLADIEANLPGRVSTNDGIRGYHANTLTRLAPQLPDAVVWPEKTSEVSLIVAAAAQNRVPKSKEFIVPLSLKRPAAGRELASAF